MCVSPQGYTECVKKEHLGVVLTQQHNVYQAQSHVKACSTPVSPHGGRL